MSRVVQVEKVHYAASPNGMSDPASQQCICGIICRMAPLWATMTVCLLHLLAPAAA